jgi:hypothetical protein
MSNVTATVFTYLGGLFQLGNGASPEVFTTITQVDSVDFSGEKRDTQKVTTADNTDAIDRFVGTTKDPGECSVELFWNPGDTTHQSLQTANDGATHNFKRTIGSHTRSFAGIIQGINFKEQIDKPTKATMKIKISGPITES